MIFLAALQAAGVPQLIPNENFPGENLLVFVLDCFLGFLVIVLVAVAAFDLFRAAMVVTNRRDGAVGNYIAGFFFCLVVVSIFIGGGVLLNNWVGVFNQNNA